MQIRHIFVSGEGRGTLLTQEEEDRMMKEDEEAQGGWMSMGEFLKKHPELIKKGAAYPLRKPFKVIGVRVAK